MRSNFILAVMMTAATAGAAMAQDGAGDATTCVAFMNMDPPAQAALVKGLSPGSGGADDAADTTMLTTIVTACQNDPTLTVGEAMTEGNSGGMQDPTQAAPQG